MKKVKIFGILIATSRACHPDNPLCFYNPETNVLCADIPKVGSIRIYFPHKEKK